MAKAQSEGASTPDPKTEPTTTGDQSPLDRPVTLGRIVHVTLQETGKVHPAIVTHVNDDQSIVATVFTPPETIVGRRFSRAALGLAAPGAWHWPI